MNRMLDRLRETRIRAVAVACVLCVALGFGSIWVHALVTPPGSVASAEEHLARGVLAYVEWDGVPYVALEYGGQLVFDKLIADPLNRNWPHLPHWLLSGMWSAGELTDDPANAFLSSFPIRNAIFGQVNDPSIVALEIEIDGVWTTYPVAAPGFALPPPDVGLQANMAIRWLDASGGIVWAGILQRG